MSLQFIDWIIVFAKLIICNTSYTSWSALFAVGNYLYCRMDLAIMLLVVFIISGFRLIRVFYKLWSEKPNLQESTGK